jgi:flagellar assembly protein FliH
LACAIAQRIVRRELKQQPELSAPWIAEALRMCAGSAEITLRLNPADHATLGAQATKLALEFHPAAPAKIVADDSITPGGCRVETEFGSIDQQIETQLERVAEELS